MPEADEHRLKSSKEQKSSVESKGFETTSISFQCFDDSPQLGQGGSARQLVAGDRISEKYEVIELLSSGGMGSVYKALHRDLGKYVAIKVLLVDQLAKDVTYRRFEREAKAAGSLNHPNIVSVYDYGLIGANQPYIVMELLDGINLDDLLLSRGYLNPVSFVQIFSQVSEALIHAHSRGLVHRDLKPSNIMIVGPDNNKQSVKIIDFGIAKFSSKKPETRPITKPGQIFGSPLYMSPEQCIGQKLDARSDIYSLGCVMYETLCGAPPFLGDTLLSTIYKHVNEAPPPFKEHSLGRRVPQSVEKLVLKMLQKSPDDRFQSASEVLTALQQVRPGQEMAAMSLQIESNLLQKIGSNKHFQTLSAIAIPVLIAIALKVTFDSINQAEQHTRISQPRSRQQERMPNMKEFLEDRLLTQTTRKR